MYLDGEGVTQDAKKAADYFIMAAEKGLVKAQYSIGQMYAAGRGVHQDDKKAYAWFYIAAENGFPVPIEKINAIVSAIEPHALEDARKQATELMLKIDMQKRF